MELLLRKYLWAVDLAVIAISGGFVARAAASAVESSYLLGGMPVHAASRSTPSAAPVYSKGMDDILKRNVFCSTCPPIIPPTVPDGGAGAVVAEAPQKTTLPLKLMAVMFSPPPNDPRWSMAIIRDTDTKGIGPYAVGAKVHDALVTDIQETRVYLDNAGKPEYLDIIDKAPPPAGPAAAPPGDALSAEMQKGIKKLGEHNYEVQRSTLDSVLGNMSMLSRSARIVPEIKDGKPAGFRLYSVRPDGPFAMIGLQNGDVISAINGLEMTSPDKALEVYTKLKSASHLSVGFERNGQKLTKEYNIR